MDRDPLAHGLLGGGRSDAVLGEPARQVLARHLPLRPPQRRALGIAASAEKDARSLPDAAINPPRVTAEETVRLAHNPRISSGPGANPSSRARTEASSCW